MIQSNTAWLSHMSTNFPRSAYINDQTIGLYMQAVAYEKGGGGTPPPPPMKSLWEQRRPMTCVQRPPPPILRLCANIDLGTFFLMFYGFCAHTNIEGSNTNPPPPLPTEERFLRLCTRPIYTNLAIYVQCRRLDVMRGGWPAPGLYPYQLCVI